MELIYPLVLIIGIPIVLIIFFLRFKRKDIYKTGKKIANTKYIEEIPYYKEKIKKYKTLSSFLKITCVFCIILSLVLLARPAKITTSESIMHNRDIFLCLDVSTSVDALNEDLVTKLKDTVRNLDGERFGIIIFNTSSVVLTPLTDDYEYVIGVLDTLQQSFKTSQDLSFSLDDDSWYYISYIQSGTLVGNEERGSSIIGDGLASCVYSFSNLEEDRTRIIIFSSDNELAGKEIVTLQEAGEIAKSKDIIVFGIAPTTIQSEDKKEMQSAVEITGGKYYTENPFFTASDIVDEIEKTGKSLLTGKKETKTEEKPQIPVILLTLSVSVLFFLNRRAKL